MNELTFEQLCALKDNGYTLDDFINEKVPFKKMLMVARKAENPKYFEDIKLERVNGWVKIGDGFWYKDKKFFVGEIN